MKVELTRVSDNVTVSTFWVTDYERYETLVFGGPLGDDLPVVWANLEEARIGHFKTVVNALEAEIQY